MAIPKQPRQLMINIMYLVLTALLALNVSAEIFNAFKLVDKGLVESNKALDKSNAKLPELIKDGAKKRAEYATYANRVDPAVQYSKEISDYVDKLVEHLIDEAGNKNGQVDDGDYIETSKGRELKGKKDKDVTTRLLVYGDDGQKLHDMILDYRDKYLELIDTADKANFAKEIALTLMTRHGKQPRTKPAGRISVSARCLWPRPCLSLQKSKTMQKPTEAAVLELSQQQGRW